MKQFDVVIVGGGHAGTEAAKAAASSGCKTALITMDASKIGEMSCNPAIGGVGKGHLVREIDALGGIMAKAADRAAIQYRLLNKSKGPAVQGPRTQADRDLYRSAVQMLLSKVENLTIIEDEVVDFHLMGDRISGVSCAHLGELNATCVVLTSGTFLNGTMHFGLNTKPGGRLGDDASCRLADRLAELVPNLGRLKTGTPARLRRSTIDWDSLDLQSADEDAQQFSFYQKFPILEQVECAITHTNEEAHDVLRENIDQTALFGGAISGAGPRYCPSIEDKITRFADKTSHQVFLEPEGLKSDLVYPNGISTSLDPAIQDKFIKRIRGLENVEIVQPGYAIEYDYLDPRCLSAALGLKDIEGLYFAGQINGTTGYEEAAAQGYVAGLNAARYATGRDPIHFSRTESYIGVMIDDLISFGVTEPYRMFTSRAEFRLMLRHDNADRRLSPLGYELGTLSKEDWDIFQRKQEDIERSLSGLNETRVSSRRLSEAGINLNPDGPKRSLYDVLGLPNVGYNLIVDFLDKEFLTIPLSVMQTVVNDARYAPYLDRQIADIQKIRQDEALSIPVGFDYTDLPGLSGELRQKLEVRRPETIAQASKIEGITPAALVLLIAKLGG